MILGCKWGLEPGVDSTKFVIPITGIYLFIVHTDSNNALQVSDCPTIKRNRLLNEIHGWTLEDAGNHDRSWLAAPLQTSSLQLRTM